jgi:hypothetical protein
VTTGQGVGSEKTEIIDLTGSGINCTYPNYPYDQTVNATGGLIHGKIPLICGGRLNIIESSAQWVESRQKVIRA